MWAAVRSRTADDDALVTEMYRQYRMPLMAYVLRLTANDETVYVPHLGGRLVALSVADGHQRWEMGGLSDGCSWAPAVVGSTAYVSARAGLFAVPR